MKKVLTNYYNIVWLF